MKEDKTVPQLRFPEFTDAWKQRKFGDSFDFLQNNTLSRASLNDTSGCAKNVHYGDILVKFGESISAEKADLPFICEREILKKLSKSILKNGDVVIADTAEDMTTGKSCEIVDVDECMPVLAGLHTIPVRPKQKFGKYYLGYYLNSEAFHSQLIPLIQGIKVYSISKSSIKDTVVMFPDDVQEQEKIGSLFNRIDNTITLQQRKLNSLQKLKKGLLQKMFPKKGENIPEIRFPEFSDAWKQCKLSDLVNVIDGDRGKNYPTEADFEPHGHTLFLNASNVTIDGFLFDTNQFITEEKSNSMGSGKIIKDDIIITSRGSLGHIAWYNDSVQQVMPHLRINSGMLILRNKANVKTSYLHQFMKSDKGKAQIVFMSFGSAQPQLTKKGVESFTVNYPIDTEEQIKIGAFFSKLDNTITLQQRKLESLQKLKKGLLQQMFI